ncbi:serine/threonine-protein kinase SAPK7 isoform X2 [Triticum aestivum]|uniref:serine/threonine-protein kinase SAPK7 isoform X2 n=1 Tax=Triticum aestivum TaxID=4565 RepID=UPI001D0295CC|nr:serine/threonine-protein kinase SAPK7-like isoform X2 [Triticum aestivum]
MERYEVLKDIGDGNVSVTRLMRNKETEEVVAVKYIPWGFKVDHKPPLAAAHQQNPIKGGDDEQHGNKEELYQPVID